ncbi:hypothetical protein D4A81_09995 [Lachnoanaerobaculum umeaense]|uniref:Uncharacterized protein n=2 Tax=Lachnoanaerobaculum umeaense TaxID=617123 RepID=A0A385Q1I2_9FIRM|nr:hypothetical protein [Lachnoanaerobaculum umeaense]AYB00239.1 hypothetical protein D4A81_09995 [Lachnoanaerobaculum umeaense]PZW96722.1 hypothetical protein C7439_11149 [Lachnoanaerobaculum umeaense]
MRREMVIQRLWTEEELEILADMRRQRIVVSKIGERLNRSTASVRLKLSTMGEDLWDRSRWSRYISKRTRNYWTYEELYDAKLILECGGTFAEAAKKTSHNSGSLRSKISMMGSDFWEERNWEMYTVG